VAGERAATRIAVEAMAEQIEPWELHSELVLVSPEVCRRALELLPERDPDAFLARPRGESDTPALSAAVFLYTLGRLGKSARFALEATAVLVGLALIAELLH
jgi:hypothetical protein